MEVPSLGVKPELPMPPYATTTAAWDPRHIFDLQHSSQQRQLLNPLSVARDRTPVLMDTSRARHHCATMGTLNMNFFLSFLFLIFWGASPEHMAVLRLEVESEV